MGCKNWIEIDNDDGMLQEVCRGWFGGIKKVTCCAQKDHCEYPEHYQEEGS